MAEKSPRRPQTPKRTGPNTIRKDKDEEEIVMELYRQRLYDELGPHDEQDFMETAKRDKSPRNIEHRTPTPKREVHGPHGINVDKSVKKAVKKIQKELHPPEHSFKGFFKGKGSKSPARPPTPMKEEADHRSVALNEETKEVVHKHLLNTDPFYYPESSSKETDEAKPDKSTYRPPTPMKDRKAGHRSVVLNEETREVVEAFLLAHDPSFHPLLPREEFGSVSPKRGQVSPKSRPQSGAWYPPEVAPKERPGSKKNPPKYSIQEALMTAHRVAQVAVPIAEITPPQVKEDERSTGFISFFRSWSFKKKEKRTTTKSEEPVSDMSSTSVHTSHVSTNLPSDWFSDRLSSSDAVTPASDINFAKLARLSEKGDRLSDSFPSEEAELGAVGGQEEVEAYQAQDEDGRESAKGRHRPIRVQFMNEANPDDPQSGRYEVYHCDLVQRSEGPDQSGDPPQGEREEGDTPPSVGRLQALQFGGCIGPFYEEMSLWLSKRYQTSPKEEGGNENLLKKGVLETSDGDYDAYYRKTPNGEVSVLRTVFKTPGEKELGEQIQKADNQSLQSVMTSSSDSEDSEPESLSSTPRAPSSQGHVADENQTGSVGNRLSRSSSRSSDVSSDSDPEMDF